jgi:hypothetical protein
MSVAVEHDPANDSAGLYRSTLSGYSVSVLRGIRDQLDLDVSTRSPAKLVKAIEDHLREPSQRAVALADLAVELRPILGLLPFVPPSGWRLEEFRELLRYVGCSVPDKALRAMFGLGLLVLHAPNWQVEGPRHFDLALNGWEGEQLSVVSHPALANLLGIPAFQPPKKRIVRNVRNVRESDGLELLLRIAVLWERIAQTPIRLTQDTSLFKRDKERLAADPVLTSPMFDAMGPIYDIGYLAIILGKNLSLLVADSERETLRIQMGTLWLQGLHAVQRKIWHALMATRIWSDRDLESGMAMDVFRLPAKRWAVLLRLASLPEDTWLPVADLDRDMRACDPDRLSEQTYRGQRPFQVVVGRHAAAHGDEAPAPLADWFDEFLLGAMYQVGAVQIAEDVTNHAMVVQLSQRGRWLLGMGAAPPAPPIYEKSLYVQPNHEVIVYRQGLSPELIGQLASFCHWKSVGAALTLELTPESIYRGLELGRTAEEMIAILERYSQRPMPRAVVDSIRTWSGRRERLRLYSQCTILEFASAADLDAAVERGVTGDRLSERLLLVAGEGKIPFDQFRLAAVRDYRHPLTVCVDSLDDGITWEVDLARSDLLVERELARFAEPVGGTEGRLQYRIVPDSLARAARQGLRAPYLREWFKQRANKDLPASVELMLQASSKSAVELSNIIVLQTETDAVADGILQHPATKSYISHRIGPTALVVAAEKYGPLKQALIEMGVEVNGATIGE